MQDDANVNNSTVMKTLDRTDRQQEERKRGDFKTEYRRS
jgi:hypothetical protein